MECPFCRKTATDFFLETKSFAAIYNIAPILPGHSLVIPRRHVESLFELTDSELAEFMRLGRDVARLLKQVLQTDAFDWAIQEKEAAGQSVAHLHMHVVPRRIGDLPNPGDWYQALEKNAQLPIDSASRNRLSRTEMDAITSRLKEQARGLF